MLTSKFFLLSTLALISTLALVESKCERGNHNEIKRFKINLDLPAAERFKESSAYYKESLLKWFDKEKQRFDPVILFAIQAIATQLDKYFPYPFNEEMRGVAEALEVDVGEVVIANLVYDFSAFCTSIVAEQKNGQIIHGRNLDYDYSPELQNVTFLADYYRNGSLLFTSAQLAGYLGVVTGHKYKTFTFSINERDQGSWLINLLFAILDRGATPLSFLTREIMENSTSYSSAVQTLRTRDLIAPAYFIVGGVNPEEGVVLTRDQFRLVDEWKLNSSSNGIESWYLLETNYDHWIAPPAKDDRRTPGMRAMNATTQEYINFDTLMDVLSVKPVCNKDTVYSVVMSAAQSKDDGFSIIIH